jgi:hypothetical protein
MLDFHIEIRLVRKEPISQDSKNISISLLLVNLSPQIPYVISIPYLLRVHLTKRENQMDKLKQLLHWQGKLTQ